jgi:serine/threonine protein kinase
MAPEILRSEKYEVSSDLWSVGCILYQCLVGRAPFVVSTHYELVKRLEKEDAVVPSDVRAQISSECFDLVTRLLDKNRDSRIAWDAYFRHPWFGVTSSGSSDLSAFSSSSSSGGTHWPMEGQVVLFFLCVCSLSSLLLFDRLLPGLFWLATRRQVNEFVSLTALWPCWSSRT